MLVRPSFFSSFFFFNDTATTEIYTLSLHDALPICYVPHRKPGRDRALDSGARGSRLGRARDRAAPPGAPGQRPAPGQPESRPRGTGQPGDLDRKSTRLNSSHSQISYAVFCLQKTRTKRRGATEEEDRALREDLLANAKERAEHVMLVDLVRNDAGRVARPRTVRIKYFMAVAP